MSAVSQRDLFAEPSPFVAGELPAHQRHSATSKAAGRAVRPRVNQYREKVLAFLKEQGVLGATREQIEIGTCLPGNTVRPRVRELIRAGQVFETAMFRPTVSGRSAVILRAV